MAKKLFFCYSASGKYPLGDWNFYYFLFRSFGHIFSIVISTNLHSQKKRWKNMRGWKVREKVKPVFSEQNDGASIQTVEGISLDVALVEDGRVACVDLGFLVKNRGRRENERFERFCKLDFSFRVSAKTKNIIYKKFKMTDKWQYIDFVHVWKFSK